MKGLTLGLALCGIALVASPAQAEDKNEESKQAKYQGVHSLAEVASAEDTAKSKDARFRLDTKKALDKKKSMSAEEYQALHSLATVQPGEAK